MKALKRIAAMAATVMILGAWCAQPVLAAEEEEYHGTFWVSTSGRAKDKKSFVINWADYVFDKDGEQIGTNGLTGVLDNIDIGSSTGTAFHKDSHYVKTDTQILNASIRWTLTIQTESFKEMTSLEEGFQIFIDRNKSYTSEMISVGGKSVLKMTRTTELGNVDGGYRADYFDYVYYYIPLENPPSSIPHTGVSFVKIYSSVSIEMQSSGQRSDISSHVTAFKSYHADYLARRDSVIDPYVAAAAAPYTIIDGEVWSPKKPNEQTQPDPDDKTDVTIDTDADDTPGETGVSVPAAIVVGLLGIVGAVGAAGAVAVGASGGDGGGESADDERRKKTYKMYIRKDFGDCIAYNKPQVTVYARMAEVNENGNEVDRSDLTAQIQIFSGGAPVQVEGCQMAGNYMGALVCAEGAQTADRPNSGVVSFLFTGEGGTFRNNVTFRLTGEPYISFPNRGGLLEMTLPMLLGDGGAYELPFEVHDFMQKPTELRVNPQGDAPVSCEVEESGNNRYIVKLQNNSVKPDKTQASASIYAFELVAENENEYAKNRFEVHLHPEGLSVSLIKMDKGVAQVGCYRDADSPEESDILPTRFKLELAVAETDEKGVTAAKIVPYAQYTPEFGKMTGTDDKTSVLVQKYECPIEAASENRDGLYRFCPKAQLPDPKAYAFTVNQPITAEYKGERYTLELPVRLIGEPLDVMKGWDEEYKRFTRIVQYYGLSAETAASVREMAKNRSTEELRLLTKMILMESMNYYTAENADFQRIGDQMAFLEDSFSVIKWFGDQAFSYLMTVATGPLGEAILVPVKEIIVSVIAESFASFIAGDEIDYTSYDFVQSLGGMLESIVMTQMSDASTAMSLSELKKLGGILAAFLVISALKHYISDLGPDGKPIRCMYSAFSAAFSDLTASAFKMIAGNYFEKLIKSSRGQSGLGAYLLKWWQKVFPDVDLTAVTQGIGPGGKDVGLTAAAKVLQKYVEEYFGYAAGVFIEASNAVLDTLNEEDRRALSYGMAQTAFAFTIPVGGGLVFAFNPGGAVEKLGDIIFDMLFDRIEFNAAPAALPPDPKYYKDGTAVV